MPWKNTWTWGVNNIIKQATNNQGGLNYKQVNKCDFKTNIIVFLMILSTGCTAVKMLSSTNQYCVLLNFIYFLIMAYVLFSEKSKRIYTFKIQKSRQLFGIGYIKNWKKSSNTSWNRSICVWILFQCIYTVNAKGFPKGITGVFLLACMWNPGGVFLENLWEKPL